MLVNAPVAADATANPTMVGGKKTMDKNDFMKLLVKQLQAQDPMSPMDAQNFSAQLAQFSSLEQMNNLNTSVDKLLQAQTTANNNSALNLIGKMVDSPGNGIDFKAGDVELLSYSLAADADIVEVDILDANGSKVNTMTPGAQRKGKNQLSWNGANGAGKILPDGAYNYVVRATDAAGKPVDAQTLASGKVTKILFEEGKTYALVNGSKLSTDTITNVSLN